MTVARTSIDVLTTANIDFITLVNEALLIRYHWNEDAWAWLIVAGERPALSILWQRMLTAGNHQFHPGDLQGLRCVHCTFIS